MGVDIVAYRSRIGTFRQGAGQDVCTVDAVMDLSPSFRTIGTVLFIGTLLLMAGIESNPGPKDEETLNSTESKFTMGKDVQDHDENQSTKGADADEFFQNLLNVLNLKDKHPGKISVPEILSLRSTPEGTTKSMAELPWMILREIVSSNCKARDGIVSDFVEQLNCEQTDSFSDPLDCSETQFLYSPLDIFNVIVRCCDHFVKALLFKKLYMCKVAIPFCISQSVYVWPLRFLVLQVGGIEYTALDVPTRTITFARLGKPKFSKSSFLNTFLSEDKLSTFYSYDSPLGENKRSISNGSIDLFWIIPDLSKNENAVTSTILNLRGDFPKDYNQSDKVFVSELTDVLIIIIDIRSVINYKQEIETHLESFSTVIFLLNNPNSGFQNEIKMLTGFCERKPKTRILQTHPNQRKINGTNLSNNLKKILTQLTNEIPPCSLESRLTNTNGMKIDERSHEIEDTKTDANETYNQLKMEHDKGTLNRSVFSYARKLGTLKRQLHKTDVEDAEYLKAKIGEMMNEKLESIRPVVTDFAQKLIRFKSRSTRQFKMYIAWVTFFLESENRKSLPHLEAENKELFEKIKALEDHGASQHEKEKLQSRWTQLQEEIENMPWNIQYLFRDLAEVCEAIIEIKHVEYFVPKVDEIVDVVAELLVHGHPLEIIDGDANRMNYVWIEKVMEKAHKKINEATVFSVSVLGLQSSGKSTLLNTMFGSHFRVSSGRCTKGVHMQLFPVLCKDAPFQYLLVFDTEGIRAAEIENEKMRRDNEISTFVTGLGDMTLLNIMGENMTEMTDALQILVHAFLRLKKANRSLDLKKSCVFVHQNVADRDASIKMSQGYQKIMKILDTNTKEAAAQEGMSDIERFSQVLAFNVKTDIKMFPNLWTGNPARINEAYSQRTGHLCSDILNKAASATEKSYKTLFNTSIHAKDLWKGVITDDFVLNFRNSLALKAYRWLEKEYQTIYGQFEIEMFGLLQMHVTLQFSKCTSVEKLSECNSDIKDELERNLFEKRPEVKKSVDKLFETSKYKEIICAWKSENEVKFEWSWNKLKDDITKELLRLNKKREMQITMAYNFQKHEELIYKMTCMVFTRFKGNQIKKDEIDEEFERNWACFVDSMPKQENSKSIKSMFEDALKTKFPNDRNDLDACMNAMQWPECPIRGLCMGASLEEVGIFESDMSHPFTQASFHSGTRGNKEYTDELLKLFNILDRAILKTTCDSEREIHGHDVRFFLGFIDVWMQKMDIKMNTIGEHLTSIIKSNVYVHCSSFALKKFEFHNLKYEKGHGFDFYLERCKVRAKIRLNTMVEDNDKNIDSTAAVLFAHTIGEFAQETIYTRLHKQTTHDFLISMPRPKHHMMVQIVTGLAENGSFQEWMHYITSPQDFGKKWIEKYYERYFNGVANKFTKSAKEELCKLFEEVKRSVRTVLESRPERRNTDAWIQEFVQSMTKYPITPELFNDIKRGFREITSRDINVFKSMLIEQLDKRQSKIAPKFATAVNWSNFNLKSPHEEVFERVWGCTELCPFCGETCARDSNHFNLKHYCIQHRPAGCLGIGYKTSSTILKNTCNYNVRTSDIHACDVFDFKCNKAEQVPCELGSHKFKDFGQHITDWEIIPNANMEETSKLWLWFLTHFKDDLQKRFSFSMKNIDKSLSKISKEDAILSYQYDIRDEDELLLR